MKLDIALMFFTTNITRKPALLFGMPFEVTETSRLILRMLSLSLMLCVYVLSFRKSFCSNYRFVQALHVNPVVDRVILLWLMQPWGIFSWFLYRGLHKPLIATQGNEQEAHEHQYRNMQEYFLHAVVFNEAIQVASSKTRA
jgi:hypothetical protein